MTRSRRAPGAGSWRALLVPCGHTQRIRVVLLVVQQHLDRLTSVDASFLHRETPTAHMHIGGLLMFEGPPPPFEEFLDHIRSRLHRVPRYRQKLATPPLESGHPVWVDDPTFNLEFHVRHTALPKPGTEDQLLRMVARIHSQPLDRSKPLWETWLVEGLEGGGRFALISKTHHALVDGIAGVDLATVLFDADAHPAQPTEELEPWQPQREPSAAELALAGVRAIPRAPATTSSAGEGSGSGCHGSSSVGVAGGLGSASNRTVARSTPETPSTSE